MRRIGTIGRIPLDERLLGSLPDRVEHHRCPEVVFNLAVRGGAGANAGCRGDIEGVSERLRARLELPAARGARRPGHNPTLRERRQRGRIRTAYRDRRHPRGRRSRCRRRRCRRSTTPRTPDRADLAATAPRVPSTSARTIPRTPPRAARSGSRACSRRCRASPAAVQFMEPAITTRPSITAPFACILPPQSSTLTGMPAARRASCLVYSLPAGGGVEDDPHLPPRALMGCRIRSRVSRSCGSGRTPRRRSADRAAWIRGRTVLLDGACPAARRVLVHVDLDPARSTWRRGAGGLLVRGGTARLHVHLFELSGVPARHRGAALHDSPRGWRCSRRCPSRSRWPTPSTR